MDGADAAAFADAAPLFPHPAGGGQAYRQTRQPDVGGQRGRDVPRALQQHVSTRVGRGDPEGPGVCLGFEHVALALAHSLKSILL